MARVCGACGDPLDAEHHDIEPTARRLVMVPGRNGPRLEVRRARQYGCRVRLIATSPFGKTFVPNTGQRIKRIDNRYVHTRRLEEGGDLHA